MICILHKKGVDLSDPFSQKCQWVLMCDGCAMSGSLKRHWFCYYTKFRLWVMRCAAQQPWAVASWKFRVNDVKKQQQTTTTKTMWTLRSAHEIWCSHCGHLMNGFMVSVRFVLAHFSSVFQISIAQPYKIKHRGKCIHDKVTLCWKVHIWKEKKVSGVLFGGQCCSILSLPPVWKKQTQGG